MNSLNNLKESMGCNTIRDDHNGGVVYQHVHMDRATFDKMLAEVEEEYSALQAENAKLREALRAAWKCANAGISCSDCRLIAGGCTLQTAMRELRIEVD